MARCMTLLVMMLWVTTAGAQDQAALYLNHQRTAFEAYGNQDYATFLDEVLAALALKPHSTTMQYNAACGYALTGSPEKAIPVLRRLAAYGIDYGAERDADLSTVRALAAYEEVRRLLAERIRPVQTSRALWRIEQYDLAPEGIAYDPLTRRTFVSGMRHGTITVIDSLGHAFEFARLALDVPCACVGIKVDNHRNLLWIAAASFPLVSRSTPEDHGATAIVALDLTTGAQVHHHPLPRPHDPLTFNDLAITRGGDIYITGGPLYALKDGETVPHPMELPEQLIGTNGIAITPDDRYLFVAAAIDGIARIDLETSTTLWLPGPEDALLTGIDGLAYHDHALYAIQNGPQPWRAVRFDLSVDLTRVLQVAILELGNPEVIMATTCVVVDDMLYYVGRGAAPQTAPLPMTPQQLRWLGATIVMQSPLRLSP